MKLKIFLIFFFITIKLTAQAPTIASNRLIGGSGLEQLSICFQTTDGGYFLGGNSSSNISGNKIENSFNNSQDYWVLKLDAQYNIVWQRTIGGDFIDDDFQQEYFRDAIQTQDGGFLLGGYSGSPISGNKTAPSKGEFDYWIVKLNSQGVIEWQNSYGGSSTDVLITFIETQGGNFLLGGTSRSNISGDKTENSKGGNDCWILKINSTGDIIWQKTIGGSGYDGVFNFLETPDGGTIVGATSDSSISGDKTENSYGLTDYWIFKLDANGNILWQKTIGGNQFDSLYNIINLQDNNLLITGISNSSISGLKTENSRGSYDYWIVKFDSVTSNVIWQKTIGGSSSDRIDVRKSTLEDTDGNLYVCGYSNSNISGEKTENSRGLTDAWIVKLNASGTVLWDKTIGGLGYDGASNIIKKQDNSFLMAGGSRSSNSGDIEVTNNGYEDYWLVELNPEVLSNTNSTLFSDFVVYPNPTDDSINIVFGELQEAINIKVFNTLGQIIDTKEFNNVMRTRFKLPFETGMYFISVENNKGEKKVIKVLKN